MSVDGGVLAGVRMLIYLLGGVFIIYFTLKTNLITNNCLSFLYYVTWNIVSKGKSLLAHFFQYFCKNTKDNVIFGLYRNGHGYRPKDRFWILGIFSP